MIHTFCFHTGIARFRTSADMKLISTGTAHFIREMRIEVACRLGYLSTFGCHCQNRTESEEQAWSMDTCVCHQKSRTKSGSA